MNKSNAMIHDMNCFYAVHQVKVAFEL